MAFENAETLSDPSALSDSAAPGLASSSLQAGPRTQLEIGSPATGERESDPPAAHVELTLDGGVQRMEAALTDAVRTEANLGLLARGLRHLSASAQAARAANVELMHELDELRSHLSRRDEEEHALRFRMNQLEQLLDLIRQETTREREFLIEQQDRFLVEILTDHDRQLGELQDRLREHGPNKLDPRELDELITQRDQAREYALRCERERDLAWQELAAGVATPNAARAPVEHIQRSPSGATAIGSISLRSMPVPAANAALETEHSSERPPTSYSLSGEDVSE